MALSPARGKGMPNRTASRDISRSSTFRVYFFRQPNQFHQILKMVQMVEDLIPLPPSEEELIEQNEELQEQLDVANKRLNDKESECQALRREKLELLRRLDELKHMELPVRSLYDKLFLNLTNLLIVIQVTHHE
jgi:response regulator RpfG family c-di-GMP phosphodiesterase